MRIRGPDGWMLFMVQLLLIVALFAAAGGCRSPDEGGPDAYRAGRLAAVTFLAVEPAMEARQRLAVKMVWEAWNAVGDGAYADGALLPDLLRAELRERTKNDLEYMAACEALDAFRGRLAPFLTGSDSVVIANVRRFRTGIADALEDYRGANPDPG